MSLYDIGTRYEHIRDFISDLEDALTQVSDKVTSSKYISDEMRNQLNKLVITYQVISRYFDSISGVKDAQLDYKISCLIDSLPDTPEDMPGGRGTPLCK